uniref:Helicase protein n=1 Tax=uncultured marine virus TaxID=186617 RepID=A0A0F7L3Y4_9VIRU|nr:helicase protein [uncultured marine virus]
MPRRAAVAMYAETTAHALHVQFLALRRSRHNYGIDRCIVVPFGQNSEIRQNLELVALVVCNRLPASV